MADRRPQRWLALIAILIVCIGVFAIAFRWSAPPPTAPAPTDREQRPAAAANTQIGSERPGMATPEAPATERVEPTVGEAAAAATGDVHVQVAYSDRTPAADVLVHLHRRGQEWSFEPEVATDGNGRARFEGVPPGNVSAHVVRDHRHRGSQGSVVAGAVTELQLVIEAGMDASGTVVDAAGAPVAGADLVAAMLGGSRPCVVGRSLADGTFHLRALPPYCQIGARKADYRPSPMRMFTASDNTEVTLTIVLEADGGSLSGEVFGPDGRTLAAACVRIGENDNSVIRLPDGTQGGAPPPQTAWTDVDGRFHFGSLTPGVAPVVVRAPGLAPWHQDVTIAERAPTWVTVRLLAGVTLVGTVRNRDGTPIAGAEVSVGSARNPAQRVATSGEHGTFRLDGLGTGMQHARVDHDSEGESAIDIQGRPGETVRWDPVLGAGMRQRGRVVDRNGAPQHPATIQARSAPTGARPAWDALTHTDADGRFVLPNCPEGQSIRATVRRETAFPETKVTFVASTEELVLELPDPAWVYIQGTVLDPDGKPRTNVHASPYMRGESSPIVTADPATGQFRLGPYPPGEYALRLSCDDLPTLRVPARELAPNEVWDVGTIRFVRGGTAFVQLVTDATAPLPDTRGGIYDNDGSWLDTVPLTSGAGRTPPLAPGRYQLQIALDGFACHRLAVDIRAGIEARLDVILQHGVPCEIGFPVPTDFDGNIDVVVLDANGTTVVRRGAWRRDGRITLRTWLAPGSYSVVATCGELRGTGALTVAAPGPAQVQVHMSKP